MITIAEVLEQHLKDESVIDEFVTKSADVWEKLEAFPNKEQKKLFLSLAPVTSFFQFTKLFAEKIQAKLDTDTGPVTDVEKALLEEHKKFERYQRILIDKFIKSSEQPDELPNNQG